MPRVESVVSVYNKTKQTLLAERVTVADTGVSRLIGLLGKRTLPPGVGVWILPANAIHTFGMRFRFDVMLIDRNYRVVGLRERIRPFSVTFPNFKARSVLELPAFTISASGTEVGDELLIEPAYSMSSGVSSPAGKKSMVAKIAAPRENPATHQNPFE